MKDASGRRLPLQHLECNEAERALGLHLLPDGNIKAELEFWKEQAYTWAAQVAQYKTDVATTWINLKTVLLTKISYPLMVTTFTCKEGESILQPVLLQALPLLGINQHFPRAMVYGHESHHGLGITHLYNKQGLQHIWALKKFPMQPGITGELLNCSYKALQVESGLPGEFLSIPHRLGTNYYTVLVKPYLAIFIGDGNAVGYTKDDSPSNM